MDFAFGEFVYFWAVVDPVGIVPVYVAVTAGLDAEARRRVAFRSVFIATAVLLFFAVGGRLLLEALEIPLPAFQIAGGVVLFLFAMTMIFGPTKPESELREVKERRTPEDPSVFPLAIPGMAGPGAMMAAVLLTDRHRGDVGLQAVTVLVLLAVLAATLALLLAARHVQRWIGLTTAGVVGRVMGLILAAVAMKDVLAGIRAYFHL